MSTCKTCKWWGFNYDDETFQKKGTCEEHNICHNGKVGTEEFNDSVYADWWITTGPNFGCIHYEKL